jgi:hypothetical protein
MGLLFSAPAIHAEMWCSKSASSQGREIFPCTSRIKISRRHQFISLHMILQSWFVHSLRTDWELNLYKGDGAAVMSGALRSCRLLTLLTMRLSNFIASLLLTGSAVQSLEIDSLIAQATSNLEAPQFKARLATNCTLDNAAVRREWYVTRRALITRSCSHYIGQHCRRQRD